MDRPNDAKRPAILRAASAPDDAQRARLTAFLRNRYGVEPELTWVEDPSLGNGFRLESGDDVFDWSLSARMSQLETRLHTMALPADDAGLIPLLRDTIQNWTPEPLVQTVGTVLSVEDGVATVSGMRDAFYGEILLFSAGWCRISGATKSAAFSLTMKRRSAKAAASSEPAASPECPSANSSSAGL